MNRTELFLFGSRFLAASSVTEEGRIEEALVKLGEKALGLSTQGA